MSSSRLCVAVAQLTSHQQVEANLATCHALAAEAAGRGAELVVFPENAAFLGRERELLPLAEPLDGPLVGRFRAMAERFEIAVLLGSFAEVGPDAAHCYNTSVLIDPKGTIVSVYRKIHLFDVHVAGSPPFIESSTVAPGTEVVTAEIFGTTVGHSVCYDLRFAELYRTLRQRGAQIMFVPAAFTEHTGRDHWEVLLRARAIENQCFVLAANQFGRHLKGRHSYGRSMIVSPWGIVLAVVGDGEGVAVTEIDLTEVAALREAMPCLDHAVLL